MTTQLNQQLPQQPSSDTHVNTNHHLNSQISQDTDLPTQTTATHHQHSHTGSFSSQQNWEFPDLVNDPLNSLKQSDNVDFGLETTTSSSMSLVRNSINSISQSHQNQNQIPQQTISSSSLLEARSNLKRAGSSIESLKVKQSMSHEEMKEGNHMEMKPDISTGEKKEQQRIMQKKKEGAVGVVSETLKLPNVENVDLKLKVEKEEGIESIERGRNGISSPPPYFDEHDHFDAFVPTGGETNTIEQQSGQSGVRNGGGQTGQMVEQHQNHLYDASSAMKRYPSSTSLEDVDLQMIQEELDNAGRVLNLNGLREQHIAKTMCIKVILMLKKKVLDNIQLQQNVQQSQMQYMSAQSNVASYSNGGMKQEYYASRQATKPIPIQQPQLYANFNPSFPQQNVDFGHSGTGFEFNPVSQGYYLPSNNLLFPGVGSGITAVSDSVVHSMNMTPISYETSKRKRTSEAPASAKVKRTKKSNLNSPLEVQLS